MKISKYLLVAAAGVMMFGCAKDDNKVNLADEGPVALSISLVNDGFGSKAAVNPSEGTSVKLDRNAIEVKLDATGDAAGKWESLTLTENAENNNGTVTKTYYNVSDLKKVEVAVNEQHEALKENDLTPYYESAGASDQDRLGTPKEAAKIPVYASTDVFTFSGTTATDPNTQEVYNLYEATVNVTIPIARLEFSDIKHVTHDGESPCLFSGIAFNKIELFDGETKDYASEDLLVDEIITDANNFKEGAYPVAVEEQAKCYAFNIFPGMPKVRFGFMVTTEENTEAEQYYAFITKFKKQDDNTEIRTFEAGKIYRISNMTITDENIVPSETGNTNLAVEVTVTVQDWTVVEGITAEFK